MFESWLDNEVTMYMQRYLDSPYYNMIKNDLEDDKQDDMQSTYAAQP